MEDNFYDLYIYDTDTGELKETKKRLQWDIAKAMASHINMKDNSPIKIIDNRDGTVVYALDSVNG